MAYTILQNRWRQQPQYPLELNEGHWLAPKMLALVQPQFAYNAVSNRLGTNTNTPTLEASRSGVGLKTNGSNQYQTFIDLPLGGNAGVAEGLTIFSLSLAPTAQDDVWHAALNNGTTSDFIFGLCQVSNTKLRNWARDNVSNPSAGSTASSADAFDSRPHFNALTWDRTNLYTSVDGVDQGSPNSWATTNFPTTARLSIGSLWIGYAYAYWVGSTFLVGAARRYIPPAGLKELAEAPFQLFRPIQRRIYVGPSAGGGAVTVNAGAGALSVTGHAPTVLGGNTNVATGVGALTVTGLAPTVTTQRSLAVDVGSLTITGYAPSISLISDTTVSAGAGALTIAGQAPTVTTQETVSAGSGALTITGLAPTVELVSEGQIAVPAASLTLTGHAPTVTTQITVSPDVAALAVTGHAPTTQVVSDTVVQTGLGALTIAGHAPTASILLNVLPDVGQIVLTGYAPTVTGGTASYVPKDVGAGKSRRKSRRKYLVEIDGQEFSVSSVEEAQELLRQAEEVAEEKADQQLARAAEQKKPKRKVIADARKALRVPEVRVVGSDTDQVAAAIEQELRSFIDRIRQQYAQVIRDIEIGAYLRKRQQEEEDDAIVTLLMTL